MSKTVKSHTRTSKKGKKFKVRSFSKKKGKSVNKPIMSGGIVTPNLPGNLNVPTSSTNSNISKFQ